MTKEEATSIIEMLTEEERAILRVMLSTLKQNQEHAACPEQEGQQED